MLRILGSSKRLCNGLTRREMLTAGGVGVAGLGLADLLRLQALSVQNTGDRQASFGKAKSCILLYLWGSPSQLETFDPKPQAPIEIRGKLGGAIPTAIPGYQCGEMLPGVSRILDRTTIVRSLTHPYPIHGIEMALTGIPRMGQRFSDPHDTRSWPFIGSVVDYLEKKKASGAPPALPRNVALPWPFSSRRTGAVLRSGPYGGFLGSAYDPVWTEFDGQVAGTSPIVSATFGGVTKTYRDPYGGITPDSKLVLTPAARLSRDLTIDRLQRRRLLLDQLEDERRRLDTVTRRESYDRFQQMAFSLLTSPQLTQAIDVHREPRQVRERYGMTLFGQSCLAARRLVEAGSKFVSVFWDEYESVNSAWDTHQWHFKRLSQQLCPTFDQAYPALLLDLEERGLLDETIVVCFSEHGRTPKIDDSPGGGRGHYSRAYSAIFAGGGYARGRVVGRTDAIAGDVESTPFSPNDLLASMYHLLGIDHETIIHDRLNRPIPLVPEADIRTELLA